jgi:hypothetical protein
MFSYFSVCCRKKSIISLLESRRVHGNGLGLTITKEARVSRINLHFRTYNNNISCIVREERLTPHERKESFYSTLRGCMSVSCSRHLPICPLPVPSLDGTHTSYVCMFIGNWKSEAICRCFL